MVLVVDTHALIWYLEGSDRLGAQALAVLQDPSNKVVVPTMVLTEMRYLYEKRRIQISIDDVIELVQSDDHFSIYPLDVSVVQAVPLGLNIHDGIICGTALVQRESVDEEVRVITQDEAIRNAGIVETVW